jgi:hypothetical protein
MEVILMVHAYSITKYQIISFSILYVTLMAYSLLPMAFHSLYTSGPIDILAYSLNSTHNSEPPYATLSGIVSSLILDIPPSSSLVNSNTNASEYNLTNIQKFILAGDWDIQLEKINSTDGNNENMPNDLRVVNFTAEFMGISKDGNGDHYHQITNFKPIESDSQANISVGNGNKNNGSGTFNPMPNILTAFGNAHILGTVDIGINGNLIWKDVNSNITISEGKTIEITLTEKDVDYHFGEGQPIYGLVNRLSIEK